jgi:hypothetical protein
MNKYMTVWVDIDKLDDEVNKQIQQGWLVLGSPVYAGDNWFAQAMVRSNEVVAK